MRVPFHRLIPDLPTVSARDMARAVAGSLVGLLVTGLLSRAALGSDSSLPLLIAPMGASAVLLFAVPASPLAQPWSILGGNLVAALVGVTVAQTVTDPVLAGALAVSLAIAAMIAMRCLHPPSGAVALTAILGGPAIDALGYGFVLWPVAGNSLAILIVALLFNNLTGRSYPHAVPRPAVDRETADPAPSKRIGISDADLDAALADYGEVLDVGREDLHALLHKAQAKSFARRSRQTRVAEIMSRDVVTISPSASLREALDRLRQHHIKSLPVVDAQGGLVGILTQTDLLDKTDWDERGPKFGLARRLRRGLRNGDASAPSARDIMTAPVRTTGPQASVAEIVPLMSDAGLHHLPVVDAHGTVVGIVSQTDLVVALLAHAAERPEPAGAPIASR